MASTAVAQESEFIPFFGELEDELSRIDQPPFFDDDPCHCTDGDLPQRIASDTHAALRP